MLSSFHVCPSRILGKAEVAPGKGKEPPRFVESRDRACAKKKEECKVYLTNPHKGYLAAHSYHNRVGKQRT